MTNESITLEALKLADGQDAQEYVDELRGKGDPINLDHFLRDVTNEVFTARKKFPAPDGLMCALTEEVGELAKAHMEETWGHVYREAVQVAAMAVRIALEGDPTLLTIRQQRGAGSGPKCPHVGCPDSFKAVPPCALCYE